MHELPSATCQPAEKVAFSACLMRQYRPTIEELKKRYAAEMALRQMQQNGEAQDERISNSTDCVASRLRTLPNSLAECFRISEQLNSKAES